MFRKLHNFPYVLTSSSQPVRIQAQSDYLSCFFNNPCVETHRIYRQFVPALIHFSRTYAILSILLQTAVH